MAASAVCLALVAVLSTLGLGLAQNCQMHLLQNYEVKPGNAFGVTHGFNINDCNVACLRNAGCFGAVLVSFGRCEFYNRLSSSSLVKRPGKSVSIKGCGSGPILATGGGSSSEEDTRAPATPAAPAPAPAPPSAPASAPIVCGMTSLYGFTLQGVQPYGQSTGNSIAACNAVCQASADCQAAYYNQISNNCLFYKGLNIPQFGDAPGTSIAVCNAICAANSDCQVAAHVPSNWCLFYRNTQATPLRAQQGRTLGLKACSNVVHANNPVTPVTAATAAPPLTAVTAATAPPTPTVSYKCHICNSGPFHNHFCSAKGKFRGFGLKTYPCNGPCVTFIKKNPSGSVMRGCSRDFFELRNSKQLPSSGCKEHPRGRFCFCSSDGCNNIDATGK